MRRYLKLLEKAFNLFIIKEINSIILPSGKSANITSDSLQISRLAELQTLLSGIYIASFQNYSNYDLIIQPFAVNVLEGIV